MKDQPPHTAVEALREAIDVLDSLNDDEINAELMPRLRQALLLHGGGGDQGLLPPIALHEAEPLDVQALGMDGHKWAAAFCARFQAVEFDDALGWFCNAIMVGFDEAARQSQQGAMDGSELKSSSETDSKSWGPTREEVKALVRKELTDDLMDTFSLTRCGKPDVLAAGCKAVGYPNAEGAADKFAGFVADAILALISPGGEAQT